MVWHPDNQDHFLPFLFKSYFHDLIKVRTVQQLPDDDDGWIHLLDLVRFLHVGIPDSVFEDLYLLKYI